FIGQINRHKNQRAAHFQPHGSHRGQRCTFPIIDTCSRKFLTRTASGYSSAGRGYRVGRPPAAHHHRTLHLNQPNSQSSSAASTPGPSGDNSGWVSRTDRHRQLINANVYEQKSQSRAKAIEETRQKKLKDRKNKEKSRFNSYLQQQIQTAEGVDADPNNNEITIEGIRFSVQNGGKKLIRQTGEQRRSTVNDMADISHHVLGTPSSTPKFAVVAGVRFHRTKTGNLVVNRVVRSHRYGSDHSLHAKLTQRSRSGAVTKLDEPCRVFSSTGSCPKGPSCRYVHDPNKVAVCKDFLKDGKCSNGDYCDLSHDLSPERVPDCVHYAKGNCSKIDCPYTHSSAPPSAPVCRAFGFRGYCIKGAYCPERHVFECPDFSNTGLCRNKNCKLPHRERASVLRNQAKQDEAMEDVSSDEDDPVGSDDVDSDDLAGYLEADSDDSDFENAKDFIPL
ncbi:hypothetical protein Golomagni_06767, partial [Golovinomyces magnicellulatus]